MASEPKKLVSSMIMRRMRAPLLVLITVYSISILGLTLIPGVDDQGNTWSMSFFHAFYYVSFTATTIGFGEIPYELSEAQRLWVLCTIYFTVIAWLYAIGNILALIQNTAFKQAFHELIFTRQVRMLREPFYLVCGLGETGQEVVKALTDEHYRAVVIEHDENEFPELKLNEMQEFVPCLIADAADPRNLEMAGIKRRHCNGVIAVTASDATNLQIAISSKLLHPSGKIACRSDFREFEENMLSFGTDHVVNPYQTFADIFSMLLQSPTLHLMFDWLSGAPNTDIAIEPLKLRYGSWILCSYGRFGKKIHQVLLEHDIPTRILDEDENVCKAFRRENPDQADDIIHGSGIDARSLHKAGIETAAGIIAGTSNDSNNLSIIMTARDMNPNTFVVARQNLYTNNDLFAATGANLIMRPREITARMIRALFLNPLLLDFLEAARHQEDDWINIVISRLSAVVGDRKPHIWTVEVGYETTPALMRGLELGRKILLGQLCADPTCRTQTLKCVPLLHDVRGHQSIMPDDGAVLRVGDRIMFCGKREALNSMRWIIHDMNSLNYVMTLDDEPEAFIWRQLRHRNNKEERRRATRAR